MKRHRWQLQLIREARLDLESISRYTHEHYGAMQERRYRKRIFVAIRKLQYGPDVIGGKYFKAQGLYTLHMTLGDGKGRHLLLYRIGKGERVIDILRVLHDAANLTPHLYE